LSQTGFYILHAAVALGAAGLYALLPDPSHRSKSAAALLLLAACGLLVGLGVRAMAAAGGTWGLYFCTFSTLALVGAVRVVTHSRPVYSALYLVLTVLSVAGLLVIADAEFLAAALVIIYAGAILVTYVFVIMLAQQRGTSPYDSTAREPFAAVVVAFVLVAVIGNLLTVEPLPQVTSVDETGLAAHGTARTSQAAETAQRPEPPGAVRLIGQVLLTRYAVALEVAGVLLLVAIVGAIWLTRRPVPSEREAAEAVKPPGQVGREVPPF
jgi:NADH-quinone oxidoreductase subunit J